VLRPRATITLIDCTDLIEVHVDVSFSRIAKKFHDEECLKLCCNIYKALLSGLKKANSTLGYSTADYSSGLNIAIACRCRGSDTHAAEIKKAGATSRMTCDKKTISKVEENQQIWYTGVSMSVLQISIISILINVAEVHTNIHVRAKHNYDVRNMLYFVCLAILFNPRSHLSPSVKNSHLTSSVSTANTASVSTSCSQESDREPPGELELVSHR